MLSLREMKKLFSLFFSILLFFFPSAVHSYDFDLMPQEIGTGEAPVIKTITEDEINELLGEDPYIGQTNWKGKKVDNTKKKKHIRN